ncbi:uncharacterized protein LOC123704555 [Colias croceus]|uniref:uncharacterized protein LOC123704555 n=1 Tax=Colias crocea TaxID=72248 RepID=UPI001E27EBD8|nr:uncharacterized protein LOC123704555 [Colias croceus]
MRERLKRKRENNLSGTNGQVYGPKTVAPEVKYWAWRLEQRHILNMTIELIRDTTYKLKHAERIQDEHKHSIGYELGTIAAGILERFLYMLKLYRYYAQIKHLQEDNVLVEDYMIALHNCQGAYHEIQLEKEMFFQILQAHKHIDPKKRIEDRIRKKLTKHTMVTISWFTKGYRRMMNKAWKPAEAKFDVDFQLK